MSDITRNVIKTKPVYLQKLVDHFGNSETARMLGLSPSGVSKAITQGIARNTTELAAQYLYEKRIEKAEGKSTELVVLKVESDKTDRAVLFRMLDAMPGVKYRRFTD